MGNPMLLTLHLAEHTSQWHKNQPIIPGKHLSNQMCARDGVNVAFAFRADADLSDVSLELLLAGTVVCLACRLIIHDHFYFLTPGWRY